MWIFGYGSLMWKTEFEFLEKKEATLYNYERDFCITTEIHRGNKQKRGLVLGLVSNEHSICKGFAYKVCQSNILNVKRYLANRELLEDSYLERFINIYIEGKKEKALTYICNINSKFYNNKLSMQEKANIIVSAKGSSGKNIDYYLNTINHLEKFGIHEEKLYKIKNHF
jgi:cation transport protein ChaC